MAWLAALILLNVPPILIGAIAPRRWLWRSLLLWLAAPAIFYWAVIAWEIATRPPVEDPIGTASYGFMLVSSIVAIPWIGACLIGFGIGRGIRAVQDEGEDRTFSGFRASAPLRYQSRRHI